MTNEVKKLSGIKRATPVFSDRLATEDYPAGDAVLKLRGLPAVLYLYVSNLRNGAEVVVNMVRFGIVGFEGLYTPEGHKVEPEFEDVLVMGQVYRGLKLSWLDKLKRIGLGRVSDHIDRLTMLSEGDKQSLDFTGENSGEDATAPEEQSAAVAEA